MDYFYTPSENIKTDSLIIKDDEFNHLVHVMRKKVGDIITVVDGLGSAYEVELTKFIQKNAEGKILNVFKNYNEPKINITIGIGILKNPSKFDFLVEKVTELGVNEIIPIKTERTIPHHAKSERWQKLAVAAMKQCGRSYLPKVSPLTSFEEIIQLSNKFDKKIILHKTLGAGEEIKLDRIISDIEFKSILLMIGPEGGFTESEIEITLKNNFNLASLGSRRLRTETSAIAACSLILLKEEI